MPKLTINSVCRRGSVYPMICNFQNGYPSEDFECECAIIQDNNGKKTIIAEFGRILYMGAEENGNIGQTLLLVRNRTTGKVRLIETSSAELKPIIDPNHDQEETPHQQHSKKIVKPLQYEESNTGIIECETISNTSTPLNSSVGGHRCKSTPSKKGSTTSFSRTHSGQFHYLHNFVVDEIRTIPDQSKTECNKTPKSIKVIETNKIEEFTVDGAKALNEANKMAARELPRNMFKDKETGLENGEIPSENLNFTIDVGTEELEQENKIIANETLEDFSEGKGTDLEADEINSTIDINELSILSSDSVDTSTEFEDENNFKSKVNQEKHEENWEMEHKNFSKKQYFVAVRGVDSKGEKKMKQNAYSSTSNNFTHYRTKNNSINWNHSENIYICDYCEAVFENKGVLIFHLISHEFVMDSNNGVIQSNIGNDRNRDLNENNDFNDNRNSKMNSKVDTTTNNRLMNNKQIVTENTSSDHPYICDCCEAVFENRSVLISHLISHEFVNDTSNNVTHAQIKKIEGNVNEHEINTDFKEKSNELKDGKNKKRNNETCTENNAFGNIYICDYCKAMFENKGQLISHLISHDFVNDTSNNVTHAQIERIMGNVNEHGINTDFNEKSNELKDGKNKKRNNETCTENNAFDNTYICDYCKAMFENKGQLISHLISHDFVNDTSNNVTHAQIERIMGNVNEHGINTDFNEKSNELKDGKNKKRNNKTCTENNAFDNTYICDYCKAMFENKGQLISHLISHDFVNDTSNNVTHAQIERIMGNVNEHGINTDFNEKSNELKDGKNKKRNNKTCTENNAFDNTYICDYCKAMFENKGQLISHLISHDFVNDTSNNVTHAQIERIMGNVNEHGINTDFNEKSNELKDGKNKKRNNETCTENNAFETCICDYCEATYENKNQLISHLITHALVKHINNGTRSRINRTIVNNENERNSDCNKKSNEFKVGDNKKTENFTGDTVTKNVFAHNEIVTENISSDNTYICGFCEAMFENKGTLISHITSHEKHLKINTPEQKSKRIINTDNYKNDNACSIIKDADNEIVTLSKTETTIAIDDNNENETAYSKNYRNKIDGNRNPELNEKCNELKDNENGKRKNLINNGLTATAENTYICDYCEAVFEDKGSLILHQITHKFSKDVDNITLRKLKKLKGTDYQNNENVNPSKQIKKQKDLNSDLKEISKAFKDKTRKRKNQVSERTATMNTYICDYCDVEFEDKGPLMLHITSHKFAKDTDNARIIQSKITTIQENNDENNKNENNSACSKNDVNSKKQKNKEFKDGFNKKIKYNLRLKSKLVNTDQGKQVANSKAEIDTVEITHDIATKLINCKHCTYKTDDTSNILKHILTHNQTKCEAIYICNDCGREFKNKAALIIHISLKNNSNETLRIRRHLCDTCNISFTSQANLINHLTELHPSAKPYKCTLCDNKYITKQGLTLHKQTHKSKPFRCPICKYQCHKSNYLKHMKSHKDSKSFECKYCDFKFDYKSRLKQHMVTHSGKKDHKCTICDSEFSLLSGLNRHLLIHSKDKHFKCENCSAGFNDLSTFKRHQKTHTGEKSYKCTHCEYSCITANDLKRHLKTHDTKKQGNGEHSNSEHFQCTMCISKFSSKYSLIRHMKIHTGEKTHKCTFCDKVFVHLTGLKRHLNVHSQNKPVICTVCNTSYDNEKSLKSHLRRSKKHKLRVFH